MKRIFPVIFLLISMFFCSCSSGDGADFKNELGSAPFSCTAEINYSDLSFTADFVYRNSANATLKITAPEELSGLKFSLDGEDLSAQYKGLEFPISSLNSSAVSCAELIFSALNRAANSSNIKSDKSAQEYYVEGAVSGKEFRLTFDKNSSAPKKFTVDDLGFSAEFKNFQFL